MKKLRLQIECLVGKEKDRKRLSPGRGNFLIFIVEEEVSQEVYFWIGDKWILLGGGGGFGYRIVP